MNKWLQRWQGMAPRERWLAYGVGLDLTRRDLQAAAKAKGGPWDIAKGFDHSAPVSTLVPAGLRPSDEARDELQQNFKSVLQAGLGKLELVTREEFDVQRAVLARTREKLEALERQLADLAGSAGTNAPRH